MYVERKVLPIDVKTCFFYSCYDFYVIEVFILLNVFFIFPKNVH